MLEVKKQEATENEKSKEKEITEEEGSNEEAAAANVDATNTAEEPSKLPPENELDTEKEEQHERQKQLPQQTQQKSMEGTLNPLNDVESNTDVDAKTKHRRYWTPKEEEKFYEIWGRENWRLTRHGKNTIFFAKWAEEMKERFNIDVKPEEVQCKVNQTRAKFRQVKKNLEADKNAVKWKKYDIVEKILKNQYRSKDDEPVPPEAIENNRDVSPTELYNCATQPSSPNSMSNLQEQNINLSQSQNTDHHLTDDINMSCTSLSDQALFCNNSQSGNSFSTELFGSDQLEIKQEIETDLKHDGFNELSNEQNTDGSSNSNEHLNYENQSQLCHQLSNQSSQVPHATDNSSNHSDNLQIHSSNPNSLLIQNRIVQNHNSNNQSDVIGNFNNHGSIINNTSTMQPPRAVAVAASPRKRNRTSSISSTVSPFNNDALETLYLEEVKKKNVLLVEQGEISRKRLRLEERKVKLMEEFFPKFMNLQQEILQKLDTVTNSTTTTKELTN